MNKGKVFLVGAGPGDPKLITVKGMECLQAADVIAYDRLVNKELLAYAKKGAELIFVESSLASTHLFKSRLIASLWKKRNRV